MRIEGWEHKLSEYFESQKDKPFRWGRNDCVLFAAKGASLQCGGVFKRIIAKYDGYNIKKSQLIIKKNGGSIENIFDKYLKRYENKMFVKRGDIAVVYYENQHAAGLIDLSGRNVVCKGKKGISFVPIDKIVACWNIEERIR